MSLITLCGHIESLNCPDEGEALYILREIRESDTLYKYEGRIGYSWCEEDFNLTGAKRHMGSVCPFIPADMRDFSFTYIAAADLRTPLKEKDPNFRYPILILGSREEKIELPFLVSLIKALNPDPF